MIIRIVFLFLFVNIGVSYGQTYPIAGTYKLETGDPATHNHVYTLILEENGRFNFHSHSDNKKGIPQIVDLYGRGTWTAKGKLITLKTDKTQDLNHTFSLDLDGSKARFVSKHPRDTSDRIVKTRLQFYDSDIFWVKTKALFKQ